MKGVVIVYAHATEDFIVRHGNGKKDKIDSYSTGQAFDMALRKESAVWRNYRLHGGKLTLVLKACNAGRPNGLAQKFSDYFEGLTVIAASNRYYAESFLGFIGSWEVGVEYGTWNLYYDNKLRKKFKGTK